MAQATALSRQEAVQPLFNMRQRIGLFLGPLAFIALLLLPSPPGMSPEAVRVAATTLWVAIWWITEAIPIPATSLLPLVLLPITGALPIGDIAPEYANPLIFVFLGGFMIALAIERWGLHRRIALRVISLVGSSPARVVLGFMIATGFLSMWISNTATAMMMMPIGMAVVTQMAELMGKGEVNEEDLRLGRFKFGTALMLGIAYAASIGGIATLIGTPPNLVLAGAAQELLGIEITFARWMIVGLPLAVVGLLGTWFYLSRVAYKLGTKDVPGATKVVHENLRALGPMSGAERAVLAIFAVVAFAWITQAWLIKPFLPMVNDSVIAIAGAIALFIVPMRSERAFLLDWDTAKKLPWGIVLLFGGGLAIASAFKATGLADWLGNALTGLGGFPPLIVMLAVVAMVIFLTEITSNTASATMLMPIMAALGVGLGVNPLLLMVPAAIAASCAFMLPVATPPNAIVFGSGFVTIPQMSRAGLWLNIGGIILVTAVGYFLVPLVWAGLGA